MDLEGKGKITELALGLVKAKAEASLEANTKLKKKSLILMIVGAFVFVVFLVGGSLLFALQNVIEPTWLGPVLGSLGMLLAVAGLVLFILYFYHFRLAKKEIAKAKEVLANN